MFAIWVLVQGHINLAALKSCPVSPPSSWDGRASEKWCGVLNLMSSSSLLEKVETYHCRAPPLRGGGINANFVLVFAGSASVCAMCLELAFISAKTAITCLGPSDAIEFSVKYPFRNLTSAVIDVTG